MDCSNQDERAFFNDRLARAIRAARAITNAGWEGYRVPVIRLAHVAGDRPRTWLAHSNDILTSFNLNLGNEHGPFYSVLGDVGDLHPDAHCTSDTALLPVWTSPRFTTAGWTLVHFNGRCGGQIATEVARTPLVVLDSGLSEPYRDSPNFVFWSGLGSTRPRASTNLRFSQIVLSDLARQPEYVVFDRHDIRALFGEDDGRNLVDPARGIEPSGSFPQTNEAFIGDPDAVLRVYEILDAAEVLCEAGRSTRTASACPLGGTPPDVNTIEDVDTSVEYLHCIANEISQVGERIILAGLPSRARDALREESSVGAYPATGGEYGAAVSAIRSSLVEVRGGPVQLAAEVNRLASDVDDYRRALAQVENTREISQLRHMSNTANELTACFLASITDLLNPKTFIQGAIRCANSLAQIAISGRIAELEDANLTLEEHSRLAEFRDRYYTRVSAIQAHATGMLEAVERLDRAMIDLERTRTEARSRLREAVFLDSNPADVHSRVNTVMRRRYNTTRVRYDRARTDAIRLAVTVQAPAKPGSSRTLRNRRSTGGSRRDLVASWTASRRSSS
ncbi:MAG: hypothetical protein K8H88_22915 [Sandaracinaceae bacterium]|nr:hypothetical protein [Sandaracinaceae bacterium]